MPSTPSLALPPRQRLAAPGRWPTVGEALPRCDDRVWSVEIDGLVERPVSLDLSALQSMPQVDRAIDIHCVTRWSKLGVCFRGVLLADLLSLAAPLAAARYVSFVARSQRGHSTSLPLADALELEALVALGVDAGLLPIARGGPVRLVVPGRYFYKSLKWLERVELLSEDRLGYWEAEAGYHNRGDVWREERYAPSRHLPADAEPWLAAGNLEQRHFLGLVAAGRDLSGLQARGATLRDADFRACRLQGACFDGANLSNARFERADLRAACFRGADLEGADFRGADLRGANLLQARLFGCTLAGGVENGDKPGAQLDRQSQFDVAGLEALAPEEHAFVAATASVYAVSPDAPAPGFGDREDSNR